MIRSFHDDGTADVFHGRATRPARRTCPETIWRVARRKLDQLHAVTRLDSLAVPPGNQLEALKRERKGQHAIRINGQFRICFIWTDAGPDRVEITDYH